MEDDIKEIPEKLEKYGVVGGIGMLLLTIAFLITSPLTSVAELKELTSKQITILTLSLVGFGLIAIALLRKKKWLVKKQIKLVKDEYDYPDKIKIAIFSQLYSRNFFKEGIEFIITVDKVESSSVTMTTELSYFVTNRTNEYQTWSMEYKFKNDNGNLVKASFEGNDIPDSPDIRFGRGIRVSQNMQAKQKSKVYFKIVEKFRVSDFELYTSYHPATDMSLIIDNKFSNIVFDYEFLYFNPVSPKRIGTQTQIIFKDGLLPYQGVRINWKTI